MLSRAAQNLAARYDVAFSEQTVERYVFESYASLRRTARIHNHLTALATRFAAHRLTALAQAQADQAQVASQIKLRWKKCKSCARLCRTSKPHAIRSWQY